jgi:hypothetical protein
MLATPFNHQASYIFGSAREFTARRQQTLFGIGACPIAKPSEKVSVMRLAMTFMERVAPVVDETIRARLDTMKRQS